MKHTPPENAQQNQTTIVTPSGSMAGLPLPSPTTPPADPANNQSVFYTQEDDLDLHLPSHDPLNEQEAPFVVPFQSSTAMPTLTQMEASGIQGTMGSPSSSRRKTPQRSLRLVKFLLIGGVVFFTMIGGGILLFAQSAPMTSSGQATTTTATHPATTPPVTPARASTQKTPTVPPPPTATTMTIPPLTPTVPIATTVPTTAPMTSANQPPQPAQNKGEAAEGPTTLPSAQLLSALGWTQAGLSTGDAVEALRTGTTFTDREMSYDYRAIGTPAHHSGTLTGSVFLLTPGGQSRFAQHDIRAINNVLFTKIKTNQIIQQVVNAQATLVRFQIIQEQGQPLMVAWVNVSFELFQSLVNPATGQRTEGLEMNPASGTPLTHQMAVVLVRVAPQNQGANAPMGGTGWLVNTYARDAQTLPPLETQPSI